VQGTVLPTMVFVIGVLLGTLRASRPGVDAASRIVRAWVLGWRPQTRATVAAVLRGGSSAAAAIVAIASVVVAVLVVTSYAQIIELYEGLQAGALGGFALTLAQIAILPNLVIWAMSWLVGPGFAIGTGSAVSPIATTLGPIPAVPVLGALPTFDSAFAFVGILIPVLAGFLADDHHRTRHGGVRRGSARAARLGLRRIRRTRAPGDRRSGALVGWTVGGA
jgi:hypothetical protein